ncbi:MAG: DNA mismatch repair endonuclease MutL [Armatimonadota bacterium]
MDSQSSECLVRLLDEHTANRIAAGEVVERPVSVVKELVENSLDAGATSISIVLQDGGKQLICVQDDGTGMSPADALLAIQRHATSKISDADDLPHITTLGFRGEALPSIASVSRFEILTRRPIDAVAFQLVIEAGEVVTAQELSALVGTTITVKELFFNTPARQKFLKSTPTELGHIVEVVGRLALVNPAVRFKLEHNGTVLLTSQGSSDPKNVVMAVFGREVAREMRPIMFQMGDMSVEGYISPPHVSRANRAMQSFFVNKRLVRHRVLTRALDDAFRSITPENRFPACAVFITLPPEAVDVNVHPSKAEVKFELDNQIYHLVRQAIRSALIDGGMMPTAMQTEPMQIDQPVSNPMPGYMRPQLSANPISLPNMSQFHDALEQKTGLELGTISIPAVHTTQGDEEYDPFAVAAPSESLRKPYKKMLEGFRILGQVKATYIIAATDEGLLIIDQHVAHERVLYEKLTVLRETNPIPITQLLSPEVIYVDRRTAALSASKLDSLRTLGFILQPFGVDAFAIRGVPAWIKSADMVTTVKDMLEEMTELSVQRRLPLSFEQLVATTACKMAVKSGDILETPEMERLLSDLAETENPYLCPHGRPVILTMTNQELDQKFKRI